MVISKLSLLDILCNGIIGLFGSDFHLRLGHLGDFDDGIVGTRGGSLQGDVMPGGDDGFGFVEGETERFGSGLTGGGGGIALKDCGGDKAGGRE